MSFENDLRRLDALGELINGCDCRCQDRIRVRMYGDGPRCEPPPADGVIRVQRARCPLHGPIYTHVVNLTGTPGYRVEISG